MKVLLDENPSLEFVTKFKALLEPEGSAIHRVVDEGWMGYENGMLMSAMETAGFTHMVTYDKKMSSQTIPTVAVLLVDASTPSETNEVAKARDLANAHAAAQRLAHDPPDRAGYYGVIAEGFPPSRRMRAVLAGDYRMRPGRIAARDARGDSDAKGGIGR